MTDQFPGIHASQFSQKFSEQQNADYKARFSAITQLMADAMRSGSAASDGQVQDAVRQHYEFCLEFWVPTKQAYKGLALSYLLPSPYRDSYEQVEVGLAKFTHDAVVIWADKNLT